MTYIAPDLSFEIVLLEQLSAPPDLSIAVVLCTPTDPDRPLLPNVSACFVATNSTVLNVARDFNTINDSRLIAREWSTPESESLTIAQCFTASVDYFIALANCSLALTTMTYQHVSCHNVNTLPFIALFNEHRVNTSKSIGYRRCTRIFSPVVVQYVHCLTLSLQSVINHAKCTSASNESILVANDKLAKTSLSLTVPCRYYPLPDVPPELPIFSCRIRPPSSQLPLAMQRKRNGLLSSHLPLPLTCWHDNASIIIPSLRSYTVHNVISATIGGISVDPLSFSIKTDMNGYCWQGGVGISPDDYAKVKTALDAPVGDEPLISVFINDLQFNIIAENQSRSRHFGKTTHNIDGRSITAKLGADYASTNNMLFNDASFASQIASQQLQSLPFMISSFGVTDWLIPASTYAVSNKTPIGVISEIADAAGGFVLSHPTDTTLSIKKRWKVSAWALSSATPDVTIPAAVIVNATDSINKATRYNTVTLIGSVGHEIYRATQGRDVSAPTLSDALFTDQNVTIPKGESVLSDSGTHAIYSLKMIMTETMPLAELGQIWQVNDTDGAWRGIVTGIEISVSLVNDAPTVHQTLTVNRYLDN